MASYVDSAVTKTRVSAEQLVAIQAALRPDGTRVARHETTHWARFKLRRHTRSGEFSRVRVGDKVILLSSLIDLLSIFSHIISIIMLA